MLGLGNPMATMQTPGGASSIGEKEQFYRYFQQEAIQLQDQIARLEEYSLVGGEKQDAIDHVLSGITSLSNHVADSSGLITAYDQRTYSQAIKGLEEKLQETRSRIMPKSRFRFNTTHKNNSALSISDAAELKATPASQEPASDASLSLSNISAPSYSSEDTSAPAGEKDTLGDLKTFSKNYNEEIAKGLAGSVRKPSFSQSTNVDISGHTGLHIILPSSASRAASAGSLTQLSRCVIDMSIPTATSAPFAGLAIQRVEQSVVIVGQVAGAVHITAVEDSIIVVASRQVRMHSCKNVDIYLHCASRPIIEDCSNVRFSPLPQCYMTSTEEPAQNHWDQVDDFKWLKAEHSPNWSILPDDQKLADATWTQVVPGNPGFGPEDILKNIGIKAK